jgi:hypothetical protein
MLVEMAVWHGDPQIEVDPSRVGAAALNFETSRFLFASSPACVHVPPLSSGPYRIMSAITFHSSPTSAWSSFQCVEHRQLMPFVRISLNLSCCLVRPM